MLVDILYLIAEIYNCKVFAMVLYIEHLQRRIRIYHYQNDEMCYSMLAPGVIFIH